jgi:polysaccharide biosynthesis/export protein
MTRIAPLLSLVLATTPLAAQHLPHIDHEPVACMLKDRFVLLDAVIEPSDNVAHARAYFTSSAGDDYYYVEMTSGNGRFVGKLPKPKDKASPVVYFLEVISAGGEMQRTPETKVEVVKDAAACPAGGVVASQGGNGDVSIVASTDSSKKPSGFSGVARVVPLNQAQAAANAGAAETPSTSTKDAPSTKSAPPPVVTATPPPPVLRQSAPTAVPDSTRPAEAPRSVPPTEFAVGAEDVIKITVIGHDDLTQTLIVQNDGTLIFPLLGRVKVADLTPKQLERRLTELLAKGYIRNPQVSVAVTEYKSKSVMVMGEVSRPGTYPMTSSMRIVDVLARAGMSTAASTEVQIIRPLLPTDRPLLPAEVALVPGNEAAPKQADILKVDLRAIQTGDLDKNITLLPNDTVYVPPAAKFYVTGETKSTGAFTYQPGITVREAVILAGGYTDNGSAGRVRVVREVEGKKRELKLKQDEPVQPGDIIVVKGKLF